MSGVIVGPNEKDLSKYAFAIQQLAQGRLNVGGDCTLLHGAATTVVTAQNCGAGSKISLTATSAHAAAEAATTYVSAVANGSFTITHANNGITDRTFHFVCLG